MISPSSCSASSHCAPRSQALLGRHYLSNATYTIQPHSLYALFVVPRITRI